MRNTLNISRRRVPRQFGWATVGGQIPLNPPRSVFTRIGDTTVHLDNHGKAGGFSIPEYLQETLNAKPLPAFLISSDWFQNFEVPLESRFQAYSQLVRLAKSLVRKQFANKGAADA